MNFKYISIIYIHSNSLYMNTCCMCHIFYNKHYLYKLCTCDHCTFWHWHFTSIDPAILCVIDICIQVFGSFVSQFALDKCNAVYIYCNRVDTNTYVMPVHTLVKGQVLTHLECDAGVWWWYMVQEMVYIYCICQNRQFFFRFLLTDNRVWMCMSNKLNANMCVLYK
jgi:hypothetical protein